MLGLSLTLGIGMMGGTLAEWSDSLFALEQVFTGEVNPVFAQVTDISSPSSALLSTTIDGADGRDGHKLFINIDNAQWQDEFTCTFEIENRGSIPVKIQEPEISIDQIVYPEVGSIEAVALTFDLPETIEPGSIAVGTITVLNNFDATGIYSFQVEIPCAQWNEQDSQPFWRDRLYVDGQIGVKCPT